MPEIEVSTIKGKALAEHLDSIARLRIQVFREWPYLYDGSLDYEQNYLQNYLQSENAIVVIAQVAGQIIGASTALPMVEADKDFQAALAGSALNPTDVFYYGESVVLPEYRGRGLGRRFFEERETHARASGAQTAAFCAVERMEQDPRRPSSYRPLDAFWQRMGFQKDPSMTAIFDWRELGEELESSHKLTFWIKPL